MTNNRTPNVILCNDAKLPFKLKNKRNAKVTKLNYDRNNPDTKVFIGLPKFVDHVNHLEDRVKDLLEIAAFVYATDRNTSRGANNQVEFQKWGRNLHFVIKVRDIEFWDNITTKQLLSQTLEFVSGDNRYDFSFESGRPNTKYHLFDEKEFKILPRVDTSIILFSGGLDSLAGILETLSNTDSDVCLVSHRSSLGGTSSIRKTILDKLNKDFPGRCKHFEFRCNLTGIRAIEESQRTRSFLYSSIAFALSTAYSSNNVYYYENGITSINFSDSQDLINARASRTTHPKTIGLLNNFFNKFNRDFVVHSPYLLKTKSDVIKIIKDVKKTDYIRHAVSCSKTFKSEGEHSHCGECSQCIDRKFAIYNLGLESIDDDLGLYNYNFINESVEDAAARKTLLDYTRLALNFSQWNFDNFSYKMVEPLAEVVDFIDGNDDLDKTNKIFNLCKRHGFQIENAVKHMRDKYHNLFKKHNYQKSSLLDMLNTGEHFKNAPERLSDSILSVLQQAIPIMFRKNRPVNENDFNDKIESLIKSRDYEYDREFPTISFALSKAVPDHAILEHDLLIESKYLRGATTPSVVTDALSSDILKYQKYSQSVFILFIISDPERKIHDDNKFVSDFSQFPCKIGIIR